MSDLRALSITAVVYKDGELKPTSSPRTFNFAVGDEVRNIVVPVSHGTDDYTVVVEFDPPLSVPAHYVREAEQEAVQE